MRGKRMGVCVALAALAGIAGRAAAYEIIAVTDGGTLAGTVKFDGAPPAPGKIQVSKDPEVCGKEKVAPELLVCADGGIANVVVAVKVSKGKKLDLPAQNPVFDQKTCEFRPHVLLFPAGATVDILNSDGILHNIHTTSTANPPTNQAQPKFKPKIQLKIDKAEWPIKVQCDAHGWMTAWWIAADNPYIAVTDDKGAFKISDLPPGDYEVEIWQEKLGKKTEKVTIPAKGEAKVDWKMGKG